MGNGDRSRFQHPSAACTFIAGDEVLVADTLNNKVKLRCKLYNTFDKVSQCQFRHEFIK